MLNQTPSASAHPSHNRTLATTTTTTTNHMLNQTYTLSASAHPSYNRTLATTTTTTTNHMLNQTHSASTHASHNRTLATTTITTTNHMLNQTHSASTHASHNRTLATTTTTTTNHMLNQTHSASTHASHNRTLATTTITTTMVIIFIHLHSTNEFAALQARIGSQFLERYGGGANASMFGWYITQEGSVPGVSLDADEGETWARFLAASQTALHAVRPMDFLWSPSNGDVTVPPSQREQQVQGLVKFFCTSHHPRA
jgi:hypothetical protein